MAKRIDENGNPDSRVKNEAVIRLQRIEGQVRGLSRLIQSDVYSKNILNQFSSIKSALNSARNLLLKGYIQNNVADKFKKDRLSTTEELIDIFKKVSK